MPPMRTGCPPISTFHGEFLGKSVARHDGLRSARAAVASRAHCAIPAMAALDLLDGQRHADAPVEQTITCRSFRPSAAAAASAIRRACVEAGDSGAGIGIAGFATIARTSAERRCAMETRTGAALTRLVVNVPAARVGPPASR